MTEAVELVSAVAVPMDADEDTPEGCTNTEENTVAVPIEVAAETPVTTTGEGLFQAPEFHVPRFQPVTRAINQS